MLMAVLPVNSSKNYSYSTLKIPNTSFPSRSSS
jgi:hypothetical protein